MIRFLQMVKGFLFRKGQAKVPRSPLSPAPSLTLKTWTVIDKERLKSFLGTETGEKIMARASARHYQLLDAASKDYFHPSQNAHAARGYGECVQWLKSLSVAQSETEQNDIDQPGEVAADDRALLAHLSP